MPKGIWKSLQKRISTAATNEDIVSAFFPKNAQGVLRYVTCENETTNCTRLMIGVQKGAVIHWLADKVSPIAGTKYWLGDDVPIEENEQVVARFTGTTSGDILSLTIRGWIWGVSDA